MNLPVIILGGGSHSRVLYEVLLLSGRTVLGYTDASDTLHQMGADAPRYLGNDKQVLDHPKQSVELVNAVGSVDSTRLRASIFERFKTLGYTFATLVHPSACISPKARLGEGAQVMAGAVIQPYAVIGPNSLVNTRASVDHDVEIGAHVHLAPGVTLSGSVKVGDRTHIGTGACAIQGVQIGANSLIAAGATVIGDIPDNSFAVGVPARLKMRDDFIL